MTDTHDETPLMPGIAPAPQRDPDWVTKNTPSEVVRLADQLRATATALNDLGEERVAATDDPLTLIRCLHAALGALWEIAPAALTAARLNPEATADAEPWIAEIHAEVTQGLARAFNALHGATNCI